MKTAKIIETRKKGASIDVVYEVEGEQNIYTVSLDGIEDEDGDPISHNIVEAKEYAIDHVTFYLENVCGFVVET